MVMISYSLLYCVAWSMYQNVICYHRDSKQTSKQTVLCVIFFETFQRQYKFQKAYEVINIDQKMSKMSIDGALPDIKTSFASQTWRTFAFAERGNTVNSLNADTSIKRTPL